MSKFLGTIPILFAGFVHITPDLSQIADLHNPQVNINLAKSENQKTTVELDTSQPEISSNDAKPIVPTTVATPAAVSPPIIKPLPRWTLTAGHVIGQELKNWGVQSGWNVIWNLPRDLIVPSTTEFIGEFPTAAAEVIKTLAANGALITAKFYEGNKTMVVNGPGVVPQN